MLTKAVLRNLLKHGMSLSECIPLKDGQECTIFKEEYFSTTNIIIYIPDMELNEIPYNKKSLSDEEIDNIIEHCCSGKDFVNIVGGDLEKAERLFYYVDWQHPTTTYDAGEIDDDEEDN